MTEAMKSDHKAVLTAFRLGAVLTGVLAIVQAALGGKLISGGDPNLHQMLAYTTFGVSVITAVLSWLWFAKSGNRGLMMHSIGVAVLAVLQIGLAEMGARTGHIGVGVLFLIAAVAMATLAIRKPAAVLAPS